MSASYHPGNCFLELQLCDVPVKVRLHSLQAATHVVGVVAFVLPGPPPPVPFIIVRCEHLAVSVWNCGIPNYCCPHCVVSRVGYFQELADAWLLCTTSCAFWTMPPVDVSNSSDAQSHSTLVVKTRSVASSSFAWASLEHRRPHSLRGAPTSRPTCALTVCHSCVRSAKRPPAIVCDVCTSRGRWKRLSRCSRNVGSFCCFEA